MLHTLQNWDVQLLATKLDTNAITLVEAKRYAKSHHFISMARTKTAFIREIAKAVRELDKQ